MFLFMNACRRNEMQNYRIASKMMAVTYFIFASVNLLEFTSGATSGSGHEVVMFRLATLIIAVSQAFLFTYSLILLLNASYVTRKRIWNEVAFIATFSICGVAIMFTLPERFAAAFVVLFTVFYVWLLFKYTRLFLGIYHKCKQGLENYYSDTEPERLRWVLFSFFAALGLGVLVLLASLYPHVYVSFLCQSLCLLFYVYFAIRFINYAFTFRHIGQAFAKSPKEEMEDRTLPASTITYIERNLKQWIAEKGFLQSNLNLNDLSKTLGTNDKYLSVYINKEERTTFRDWINALRIQEAKTLLVENPDTPIKDIAYDVGFGSHAHFGKLFLENTGFTPQTWRNRNKTSIIKALLVFLLISTTAYGANVWEGLEIRKYNWAMDALPVAKTPGCDSVYSNQYREWWYFNVDTLCEKLITNRYAIETENLLHHYYTEVMANATSEQIEQGYRKMKEIAAQRRSRYLAEEAEYMLVYTDYYSRHWGSREKLSPEEVDEMVDKLLSFASRANKRKEYGEECRFLFEAFMMYNNYKNYAKAFALCYPLLEKMKTLTTDDYIQLHYVYFFIGNAFYSFHDYQRAIPCLKKALHTKNTGFFADRSDLRAKSKLADHYADFNQLDSSDYYYRSMYDNVEQIRFRPYYDLLAVQGIASNMVRRGMYAEALPLIEKWLPESSRLRWPVVTITFRLLAGECYLETGQTEKTRQILESTRRALSPKIFNTTLHETYYRLMLHYQQSEGSRSLAKLYTDSLRMSRMAYNERTTSLIVLRAEQEVIEKERALMEAQMQEQKWQWMLTVLILSAIALIIGIFAFLTHKKNLAYKTLVNNISEMHRMESESMNLAVPLDNNHTGNPAMANGRKELELQIRELLFLEKLYRNPDLSKEAFMERLNINRYKLEEAFTALFGMNYYEYILHLRLHDAITLLQTTDLQIKDIATQVGFGAVRSFQRQFQTKYSITPKEFRDRSAMANDATHDHSQDTHTA